mmetsp:Transcript_18809/g.33583  ORF Transcript_18809/g.33583 Transcript_18809/m.33583 type:complete len:124 (-) Transcript_18809:294-665(-)
MESLQLSDKQLIVFAVNNNRDVDCAGGGSHWSTLVYFARSKSFVHFDSLSGGNSVSARRLFETISDFFNGGSFKEGNMRQQENGHDCGLFVLGRIIDKVLQRNLSMLYLFHSLKCGGRMHLQL